MNDQLWLARSAIFANDFAIRNPEAFTDRYKLWL
jgi:hypothetical protein